MSMESQHVLIIGAGLAGTSLAHELLARGHRVQMVDRGENHSTAIAAGMICFAVLIAGPLLIHPWRGRAR